MYTKLGSKTIKLFLLHCRTKITLLVDEIGLTYPPERKPTPWQPIVHTEGTLMPKLIITPIAVHSTREG